MRDEDARMFHVERRTLDVPAQRPLSTDDELASHEARVKEARDRLRQFARSNPRCVPLLDDELSSAE